MRRAVQGFFIGFIILILGLAAATGLAYVLSDGQVFDLAQLVILRLQLQDRHYDLHAPFSGNAETIRFQIPPGAGAARIAAALQQVELIRDPQLFIDYARVQKLDRHFEAGIYFLNQTQSIAEIAPILTDSSSSYIPFRILEGLRIEETAALIDRNRLFGFTGADFLQLLARGAALPESFAAWAGIPDGASLEGFLFPDTYQLPPEISPGRLRDLLLNTFRERVGDQLRQDALAQDFSIYQIVTLASIIEREAVWPDEHAMIASVYRNRLAINMKLEADPTVQYGLQGSRGSWWPNITRADYQQVASPYNTYLVDSLPPGPIASPGLSAIQAATYPAESNYFYFRAACDGSHYHNFAVNFAEHLQNGC